jgi:hypothetical protein
MAQGWNPGFGAGLFPVFGGAGGGRPVQRVFPPPLSGFRPLRLRGLLLGFWGLAFGVSPVSRPSACRVFPAALCRNRKPNKALQRDRDPVGPFKFCWVFGGGFSVRFRGGRVGLALALGGGVATLPICHKLHSYKGGIYHEAVNKLSHF